MTPRIDIEDMTDAQDEAPERIWLQEPVGLEYERTWCAEQQSDDDTPYVRADLARPSQAGDERVAQAVQRVAQYLGRRKKTRSDDPDFIHGYDVSPEGGFVLSASDLAVMVAALAAMDTPKGGGDE